MSDVMALVAAWKLGSSSSEVDGMIAGEDEAEPRENMRLVVVSPDRS